MSAQFTATAAERGEYETWFTSKGGNIANDTIGVQGAREFFLQSGQSNDVLAAVWRLANRTNSPDSLRFSDFCIAANLLIQLSRRQLPSPPATLLQSFMDDADSFAAPKSQSNAAPTPFDAFMEGGGPATSAPSGSPAGGASAFDAAAGFAQGFGSSSGTGGSPTGSIAPSMASRPPIPPYMSTTPRASSPMSPITMQRTGGGPIQPLRAASIGEGSRSPAPAMPPVPVHVTGPGTVTPVASHRTGGGSISGLGVGASSLMSSSSKGWAISQDKQKQYAAFFANLDKPGKGYLTGGEVFEFFTKSNLPSSDLSKIWNLTCVDPIGGLRKDDFVVAMYLIYERLADKPIPDKLPDDVIPPSRRTGSSSPTFGDTASVMGIEPQATGTNSTGYLGPSGIGLSASTQSLASVTGANIPASSSSASRLATFDDVIGRVGTPNAAVSAAAVQHSTPRSAMSMGTSGVGMATPPSSLAYSAPGSSTSASIMASIVSSGPAGALQGEQQELANLTRKTEDLSLQRVDMTNQINSISIEKQNLQIRLGQVKATHDAEVELLKSLRTTLEKEQKARDDLKDEVLSLEKQRVEMQGEKADLQAQMQNHRNEADAMRNKIIALNFEINAMRQELATIRDNAKREQENFEFNRQSVQNIEETKGVVQAQLDEEKRKAGGSANVPRSSPPQVSGQTRALSGTAQTPSPQRPPVSMSQDVSVGGRQTSPASDTGPMPAQRRLSATSNASANAFDMFALPNAPGSPNNDVDRRTSMDSLRQNANKSPTAMSTRSFDAQYPSPSKLAAASSPAQVSPPPTQPKGTDMLASLTRAAGTKIDNSDALSWPRAASPASTAVPSSAPPTSSSPWTGLGAVATPPLPTTTGSPMGGTSSVATKPASASATPVAGDVPDEYKKEFDDFAWDFPSAPAGKTAAANVPPSRAPPAAPTSAGTGAGVTAAKSKMNDAFDFMFGEAAPSTTGGAATSGPQQKAGATVTSTSAPAPAQGADQFDFDPFGPAAPATSPTAFPPIGSPPPTSVAHPPPATAVGASHGFDDDPFAQFMSTGPTGPAASSPGAPPAYQSAAAGASGGTGSPVAGSGAAGSGSSPKSPPAKVAAITQLGFSRDQAVDALERYDFDVQKASNFLVDEMSK